MAKILDGVLQASQGPVHSFTRGAAVAIQVVGSVSIGVGAASVAVMASNELELPFIELAQIDLVLGTNQVAKGFTLASTAWKHLRIDVKSLTGISASVSVYMNEDGGR
jgi:hypothetical protein